MSVMLPSSSRLGELSGSAGGRRSNERANDRLGSTRNAPDDGSDVFRGRSRRQFGMPEIAFTPRTCIVVVQVQGEAGAMLLGVIVDEVAEVVNIPEADIVDAPDFGRGATTPYVLGMAKSKGKVKILLDIDRLLNIHELQRAARSAE